MRLLSFSAGVFLVLMLISTASASLLPSSSDTYCKCICFSNYTIVPLIRPTNPAKPCLSCNKQFCLDQKLPICRGAEVPDLDNDTGTGKEGDVEARCFQRDSPRDQLVVTCFILIVFGLLMTAAIRARLAAAIAERGRPGDLREWGEALIPPQIIPTSLRSPAMQNAPQFSLTDLLPESVTNMPGMGFLRSGDGGRHQRVDSNGGSRR